MFRGVVVLWKMDWSDASLRRDEFETADDAIRFCKEILQKSRFEMGRASVEDASGRQVWEAYANTGVIQEHKLEL